MHIAFRALATLALGALAFPSAAADGEHLLLSEVGVRIPGGAEFVEIFNPTTAAVPLGNYYYADTNSYKDLPKNPGGITLNDSDQILRFPSVSLASGQTAVITQNANTFLKSFFPSDADPAVGDLAKFQAQNPSNPPLLFEIIDSHPDVPELTTLNTIASPGNQNFSLTDSGEFALLFYWDGTSDLVKDVDIVGWGTPTSSGNWFAPKTTAHTGANGTPYLPDAGTRESISVAPEGANHIFRNTISEVGEVATGGNGLTGHDETTENTPSTWTNVAINQASPGVTNLVVVGENQPPVIQSTRYTPQYPSPDSEVTITVVASDNDGTVAAVNVFYSTGGAYTSVPTVNEGNTTFTVNLGSFPDATVVRYYAQAIDNDGGTVLLPPTAPEDIFGFHVRINVPADGDLVINEIYGDNPGSDAYEWLELHNTTDEPMDLSFYKIADNGRGYTTIPYGTIIAPKGYAIATMNVSAFNAQYTVPPGTPVFDWGGFGLNNDGDDIVIVYANSYYDNQVHGFLDRVVYRQHADDPQGWPYLNQGSTLRSLELINPALDNNDPSSWAGAIIPPTGKPGTPGAQNSVYAGVLLTSERDITFPTPNQAFTIRAAVNSIDTAVAVTGVNLMVDISGGGFTPQPMTLSEGTTFTRTIGGYPENTVVRYYFEVSVTGGSTFSFPPDGATNPLIVLIKNDVPEPGDIVINEILYDNFSNDLYEYIELYNTTNEPIDLSYFKVMTNQLRPFTIPVNSIILPNNYFLLTYNDFGFRSQYGNPPAGVPLVSWNETMNVANAGDHVRLIHPNQFYSTSQYEALESVDYGIALPWPSQNTNEPGGQNPNATGASIELINPNYPDRGTNGERWRWTTTVISDNVMGTPGLQNSSYSGVSDWTLY